MNPDFIREESGIRLIRKPGLHLLDIEPLFKALPSHMGLKVPELIHWNEKEVLVIECKRSFPDIHKRKKYTKEQVEEIETRAAEMGYALERESFDIIWKFFTAAATLQCNQVAALVNLYKQNLQREDVRRMLEQPDQLAQSHIGERAMLRLILIINPEDDKPEKMATFPRAVVEYSQLMKLWHKQKIKPLYPNSELLVMTHQMALEKHYCEA